MTDTNIFKVSESGITGTSETGATGATGYTGSTGSTGMNDTTCPTGLNDSTSMNNDVACATKVLEVAQQFKVPVSENLVPTLLGAPVEDESKVLRIKELQVRTCKKNKFREVFYVFEPKPGAPRKSNVIAHCKCLSQISILRCVTTVAISIEDIVEKYVADRTKVTQIRLNGKTVTPKQFLIDINILQQQE